MCLTFWLFWYSASYLDHPSSSWYILYTLIWIPSSSYNSYLCLPASSKYQVFVWSIPSPTRRRKTCSPENSSKSFLFYEKDEELCHNAGHACSYIVYPTFLWLFKYKTLHFICDIPAIYRVSQKNTRTLNSALNLKPFTNNYAWNIYWVKSETINGLRLNSF